MIITIMAVVYGILGPAMAKLMPWIMEMNAEAVESSGIIMSTQISVDALISWDQFFSNILILLIIVFITFSGIFTVEYQKGTLINMLTKRLKRRNVVLSKFLLMFIVWTATYSVAFGVSYAYNEYYWDNSIAQNLLFAFVYIYILGVWIISLITLGSTLYDSNMAVMLMTGMVFAIMYLANMIKKISKYLPVSLTGVQELVHGNGNIENYIVTLTVTGALAIINIIVAVNVFNKKTFK